MKEGRKLKSIDPMSIVGIHIMPSRNGASNQFNASIDITETEKFIHEKRAEGAKGLGIMHVILAAYVRTTASHPGINRFIRGQKIYARNSVEMCMTIKKKLALNAPETVIKISATPEDTIDDIYQAATKLIEENKEEQAENGMDVVAKILAHMPRIILKSAVWLLRLFDYFGLLPRALIKVSPFHGSMYITNVGSLGIDAIFHHLYDFGNLPLFIAMGKKRTEYKLNSDGTVQKLRLLDITVVCDERICDGHYYASAFKTLKKHIENPASLDAKPAKVVCDIK